MKWEKIGNIAGQRGKDGKDAALDLPTLKAAVAEALPPLIEDARAGLAEVIARTHGDASLHLIDLVGSVVKDAVDALPPPAAGRDGRDTDPEFIRGQVLKEVAQIPAPLNGKDADPEMVRAVVSKAVEDSLPELVNKAQTILAKRVEQAEAAIPALVENARAALADQLAKAAQAIPIPKDGKDADPEFIRAEIRRSVDALPKAEPGKDADPAVMRMQIVEELSRLPPPLPGKDADPETIRYEIDKALSQLPRGKDGKDGLGIDDFDVELQDDGRVLVFKLESGDRKIVREVRTAFQIYREVFKSGHAYQRGDTFTFGGSQWHTVRDATGNEKPGDGSGTYRLSVKKGTDGKDVQ